jgi:trypsin
LRRTLLGAAIATTAAVALVPATPAGAIVGGTPDTVHTNVGLVRFTTVDGRFRCSGTLISARVVLTAGHCTEGPATNVYVSFDDALQPDPLQPGVSPAEKAARASHYITGTAHPDPGWDGKLSFSQQHDQGVVVLDAPAH